jgi:hypothetical protein
MHTQTKGDMGSCRGPKACRKDVDGRNNIWNRSNVEIAYQIVVVAVGPNSSPESLERGRELKCSNMKTWPWKMYCAMLKLHETCRVAPRANTADEREIVGLAGYIDEGLRYELWRVSF